MSTIWVYTIGSSILVSLMALVGIATLAINDKLLKKIVILLVSLSGGALIGDAFIHILPETINKFGFDLSISLYILAGILLFFVLEKFIHWHHCRCPDHKHNKPFVTTLLVGDSLHNFVDGLFIATSYLIDIHLGVATTIAVIFHEIPQEIGDFGVLVHGGMKKTKAIFINFLTALTALLGAITGLLIGSASDEFLKIILPLTAGGFIYVANADLFPELHKKSQHGIQSIIQFLMVLIGIGIMAGILFIDLH